MNRNEKAAMMAELKALMKDAHREACKPTLGMLGGVSIRAVQAQRVVVMHKGNVLMDGAPREIFTQVDKLRAASLTVPQTIEVLYDLDQQDGEKLPIDALSIEECADILEQEYLN